MTFHTVGCSGDFKDHVPGLHVAKAMAVQISNPRSGGGSSAAVAASFLYHLGDLVYKDEDPSDPEGKDQALMYNSECTAQYTSYGRNIFAIAGNHDSKSSERKKNSAIDFHFLQNFCDSKREASPDNRTDKRLTMIQPYPYWLFETSVAYFVGLYTNDINGGQLDDPMGTANLQYHWLVKTLKKIKDAANGKAVFLALHYPPYSGAADFAKSAATQIGCRRRAEWLQLGSCNRLATSVNRLSTRAVSILTLFSQLTLTSIRELSTHTPTGGKFLISLPAVEVMHQSKSSLRPARVRRLLSLTCHSMSYSLAEPLCQKGTQPRSSLTTARNSVSCV